MGITAAPILGKLFEITILPHLSNDFGQCFMQFGFTEGLSPIISDLGALMQKEFLCISVLRVASRPRVKLASCKSALTAPPPPSPPPPPLRPGGLLYWPF